MRNTMIKRALFILIFALLFLFGGQLRCDAVSGGEMNIGKGEGDTVKAEIDGNILRISGSGNMTDWSNGGEPFIGYKDSISTITIAKGVKTIGNYAFKGLSNVTIVNMPEDILSIGDYAFADMKQLKMIHIYQARATVGTNAFDNCNESLIIRAPEMSKASTYAIENDIHLITLESSGSDNDHLFFRLLGKEDKDLRGKLKRHNKELVIYPNKENEDVMMDDYEYDKQLRVPEWEMLQIPDSWKDNDEDMSVKDFIEKITIKNNGGR